MLDHVFTDAIGALRDAVEGAFLERQAFEERFQSDVLLGDLTWETAYSLPGEGAPPRVRADLSLSWPTWSQSTYRSWYIGEDFVDPPHIEIEIVLRVQRLAGHPDLRAVLDALPAQSAAIGSERLQRGELNVEVTYDDDLQDAEYAVEVSYEGSYELDEAALDDGSALDEHFATMGGWIAATLVRLGDLPFEFLPTEGEAAH